MYVYRVHHVTDFHHGPYTFETNAVGGAKCWSGRYMHRNSYDFSTSPVHDFSNKYWHSNQLYFGFHTIESLYNWFSIRDLTGLIADGFKVSRVEAELVIVSHSGKQCCFKPKE